MMLFTSMERLEKKLVGVRKKEGHPGEMAFKI